MNKLKTFIILIIALMLSMPIAEAQKPVAKDKARLVLLRTNRLIGHAHMSVKRGKVYTGNLGKAVRNQRYAKKLYLEGNYLRAIHYSRRARLFALDAIKANKVKPTSDATITPEENEMMGTVPSDQELDDELAKESPKEIKDEELVNNNNLELDVK